MSVLPAQFFETEAEARHACFVLAGLHNDGRFYTVVRGKDGWKAFGIQAWTADAKKLPDKPAKRK